MSPKCWPGAMARNWLEEPAGFGRILPRQMKSLLLQVRIVVLALRGSRASDALNIDDFLERSHGICVPGFDKTTRQVVSGAVPQVSVGNDGDLAVIINF